jgi:hypothetical protein
MATLTVKKLNYGTYTAGATPTWTGLNITNPAYMTAAAAGGDKFVNDGRTFFMIENLGGTACVATFKNDEGFIQDLVVSTAITTGRTLIGPFNTKFNDSSGMVVVTYSFVTTVWVAAISLAESGT